MGILLQKLSLMASICFILILSLKLFVLFCHYVYKFLRGRYENLLKILIFNFVKIHNLWMSLPYNPHKSCQFY